MLIDAFKHYSKYASQALKVAMPKGGMRGDINPRHMQQVRRGHMLIRRQTAAHRTQSLGCEQAALNGCQGVVHASSGVWCKALEVCTVADGVLCCCCCCACVCCRRCSAWVVRCRRS